MGQQGGQSRHGREEWSGPRPDQTALQRDAGQDLQVRPALEHQAVDEVETIELGSAGGHVRQVPAGRWRGPADAPLPIEGAPAFENAMNRSDRGHLLGTALAQCPMNLSGAVVAQITGCAQFVPHGDHEAFELLGDVPWSLGRVRPGGPVNAIEPPGTSVLHPTLHGTETHVMGPSDAAHRGASSHRSHHRLSSLRRRIFSPC